MKMTRTSACCVPKKDHFDNKNYDYDGMGPFCSGECKTTNNSPTGLGK